MPAVEMTLTDVTDEERRCVADVYADGKINVRDVTAIQRMLAEMELTERPGSPKGLPGYF